MKRILLAMAAVAASAQLASAAPCPCQRQPVFPRLRAAIDRVLNRGQTACESSDPGPITTVAVQAAETVRQIPDALRGLTLLPGSSGGCGPLGCPRLPAGLPR